MQLYELQVSKTAIYAAAPVKIPQGIVGAVIRIRFSPEWENLKKTVVFRAGDITKDILDVEEFALIPAECTKELGRLLEVGVYGVDAENTLAIPTLWAPMGRITEATDPSGDTTTDPTLPVWAQLQKRLSQLEETGVPQAKVEEAVRSYFTENPITAENIGAVPTHRKINNKELTGDINLTAADVGARPGNWKPDKYDVGLGNLDNERQYSASNPPPYPVSSVNGKTGAVVLGAADVGAAPNGFGLGGACVDLPDTDWNKATVNGWYTGKINNIRCVGVVSTYGYPVALFIHQRVYQVAYSDSGDFMVSMERKGYDSTGNGNYTWTEWEYVNPPMDAGVEYRTTERSSGSPVYAKKISATFSASNEGGTFLVKTPHGISGFNYLVDFFGKMGKTLLPTMCGDTYISLYQVDETNISFYVKDRAFSGGCTFILRYTKK